MAQRLRFDSPERLRIAIAGRANSGKTSLVQTLLRSPVGEVDDRAGVTIWPDYYADDELGVILVDCPGFEEAEGYRTDQMVRSENPVLADRLRAGRDFSLETRTMGAVSVCNLVIYVATMETVPDRSHGVELQLLSEQTAVVGLLNKRRLAHRALDSPGVSERVRQWKTLFSSFGVPVAEYDAHTSPPSQLMEVLELIKAHLDGGPLERMRDYVAERERRVSTQRDMVAGELARRVIALRTTTLTASIPRDEYSPPKGEQMGTQILLNTIGEQLAGFVGRCADVYGYRSQFENDGSSVDADIQQYVHVGSLFGAIFMAVGGANAGATAGAGVLGALGGIVGFFTAGPGGAWIGAEMGGKLGMVLGGLGGGIGAGKFGWTGEQEATVRVGVDERALTLYVQLATAWAAALAYRGFGKGEVVGADAMRELREEVGSAVTRVPIKLTTASEDEVRTWMRQVLLSLGI